VMPTPRHTDALAAAESNLCKGGASPQNLHKTSRTDVEYEPTALIHQGDCFVQKCGKKSCVCVIHWFKFRRAASSDTIAYSSSCSSWYSKMI